MALKTEILQAFGERAISLCRSNGSPKLLALDVRRSVARREVLPGPVALEQH
ncbi:MAG TPA: hypothetical protein VJB88_12020 [Vicinamibacteria bacterium]|nr:hypothetical protein [Vicinamibacteria bacterium]